MFTGLGTVGRLGQGVVGWGGRQVSSLRRTAEKRDLVIQSEAELNRQLSQIITCLSEAISIYVKLCKAISSQLFFPQRLPSHPSEGGLGAPKPIRPILVQPGTPLVRLWYTLKPQKRSMVPGFGTPGTPCGRGVGGWPRRMSLGSALPFASKPNQGKSKWIKLNQAKNPEACCLESGVSRPGCRPGRLARDQQAVPPEKESVSFRHLPNQIEPFRSIKCFWRQISVSDPDQTGPKQGMMLRIAAILEGHGECEAVPILVRRIARLLSRCWRRWFTPFLECPQPV